MTNASTRSRPLTDTEGFAALVEELPFDVWLRDATHRCVYANETAREHWPGLVGQTPESTSIAPSARTIWRTNNERALAGEVVHGEVTYEHGSFFNLLAPVRREGTVVGTVGVNVDITELVQARRELALRQRLLGLVSDVIPVLVGVRRLVPPAVPGGPRDLLHVFNNERVAVLLGRSLEALRGAGELELGCDPQLVARAVERFEHARKEGVAMPFELVYPHADGTRVLRGQVAHLPSADDDDTFAVVGEDITELRSLQAELVRVDRLSSLASIAAVARHEIANPITFAGLALDELRGAALDERLGDAEFRAQSISVIGEARDGVRRAAALLDDLRALEPMSSHASSTDLGEVVKSVLGLVRSGLQQVARVELELVPAPPVFCDPLRMGQVVLNLVKNAREAFERPTDPDSRNNRIRVTVRPRDGGTELSVTDNGRGVPSNRIDELFEPFRHGDHSRGSGLGLYIVRTIVDQASGQLEFESAPGEGTVVRVWIPEEEPA